MRFAFSLAIIGLVRHCVAAAPSGVPTYVIDYAPLVYLYSTEPYNPSDISAQLSNTQPEVNYAVVSGAPSPLTLDNIDQLNNMGNTSVYLTSKTDITKSPAWLNGIKPDSTGKTVGGITSIIIVNDHGNGNLDAFYMYFYAYNWGGKVLGLNFGNHVGDWEHNMIRFKNGVPTYIWYSQHSNGECFKYSILNKSGLRPVVYSANGSHANYAIPGDHDHLIPNFNLPQGVLEDHTDAGALWDPTASAYWYAYNAENQVFTPYDATFPVNWLNYTGHWGDQQYPNSDKRQFTLFGQYKYASGPNGPKFKQLNRTEVCPDNGDECIYRTFLVPREEREWKA